MKENGCDIRVGISSCLLGQKVRYDGQHKRDPLVTDLLAAYYFTFIPARPEVEIGLGIPRETIRLERSADEIHLCRTQERLGLHRGHDRLFPGQSRRVGPATSLSGYILKKNSPSCGMERVKVYSGKGPPTKTGRGLFALDSPWDTCPSCPLRRKGGSRIPACVRTSWSGSSHSSAWRTFCDALDGGRPRAVSHRRETAPHGPRPGGLRDAGPDGGPRQRRWPRKRGSLLPGCLHGSPPQHCHHAQAHQRPPAHGRLFQGSPSPDGASRAGGPHHGLPEAGPCPLIVPITLIRHFVRRYKVDYSAGQTYLEPHPKELMLRNHV